MLGSSQSHLFTHLPLSSAGETCDIGEVSYGFWSLVNTYPLLSNRRNRSAITVFSLHVSSLKWKEMSLCYSCSRKLPQWDPVEWDRQIQAPPAGPKGANGLGAWGGRGAWNGMTWMEITTISMARAEQGRQAKKAFGKWKRDKVVWGRKGKWCKVLPSTGWKSAAKPLLALARPRHM